MSTKDVSEVDKGDRKSTARPSVKNGAMLRGSHIIKTSILIAQTCVYARFWFSLSEFVGTFPCSL